MSHCRQESKPRSSERGWATLESRDGQQRNQNNKDDPNINAHQSSN
jgi:hypothetical protein